ncbi:MAG: hemolysin family protein [Synergistaceae bacterium]|nr:hemolysin family protein [Synergistaceae bacterium]
MSSDIVGSICLLLVLLLISFYFSATETAITAAGKIKLMSLENTYPERKKGFEWLAENVQQALTVTLVCNNIVNVAASSVATTVAVSLYGRNGPIIAIVVMATVIVIFCEILPKSISMGYKEPVINFSLPVLRLSYFFLRPVIFVVQHAVLFLGGLFGLKLDLNKSFVTRADLEVMIRESGKSGALEEDESKMIHGVIAFEETRVSEVMIPRTDMKTVPSDTTVADASVFFLETGHSRVPAYEKELDKITGVLYAKDLLGPLSGGLLGERVDGLLRKPLFIPETIKTDEAFELMKKSQIHIAIVVDEYGGTAGLVTLEDLLEEIVGDIQDEYDDETPDVLDEGGGSYLVQGYVNIEDLSETLGYPFEFEDVDTVAGMLLTIVGDFPDEGQSVRFGPWRISAVEVVDHRILQVRMELVGDEESPE